MIVTAIPDNYAPVSGGLVYRADLEQMRESVEVLIINTYDDNTIGRCRFCNVDKIDVDIAYYVNRAFNPQPSRYSTGIHRCTDRTVRVLLEIDGIRTEPRIFSLFACDGIPRIVSGLNTMRRIACGERDEIPVYAPYGGVVTLAAWQDGQRVFNNEYNLDVSDEVQLLVIDTNDLPDDITRIEVSVDGGGLEELITYRIAARHFKSIRLSWVTSFGSIESYTFPSRSEVVRKCVKSRYYAEKGYISRNICDERITTLAADPEPPEMTAALEEILSSQGVWSVRGCYCVPVDVVSSECRYGGDAEPAIISIEVRPQRREEVL